MARACVVVPTKNEGPKVTEVIASVKAAMASTAYSETVIIVVDDSTDDTKSIARKAGAVVLRGDGDGLGAAMYRGLKKALTYKPQVILAVDGDGQADAAEIPRFLEPIEKGEADLVLGSRFAEAGLVDYKYRWRNRLGTWILVRILRSYTGLPLTDSHGGLRAMVPELVERLEMLGTHTY
ncbi:MAG: glycosyltransferase family 2 protein, partial [Desulfarculaceae bacterium]